jgi:ABC-type Fe3+ transport system permease subunit
VVAQDDRLSPVRHVVLAAAVWITLTVGSLAIVLRVVLALPVDYFERERPAHASWTLPRLAKNVAGLLLIIAGAVLSIPGVPGQGLLTMLAGLLLVDFPQRRKLERILVRQPRVLTTLNRLRARWARPPLRLPPS